MLVILEYGPLWMKGAATCEMTTSPETLIAMTALQAQDIHQFSMSDLTRDQRVEGARKELAQYEKYEVWHPETPNFIVDEKEIPRGATVVSSTHVERPKLVQKKNEDGTLSNMRELVCKGRLCLRGFEVAGLWGARTDAPTISRSAFLLFLTICMWMAFDFLSVDISAAFLNGLPFGDDRVLYMMLPRVLHDLGLTPAPKCWRRLRKPPYGLEDVPRSWYRRIARYLKELGFVVSLLEPCLFFLWVESTLVCVVVLYVDDLFAGGTREYLNYVIEELQKEFDLGMIDRAEPDALTWTTEYTGRTLTFTRSRAGQPWEKCTVDQHAYIRDKLGPAQANAVRKHVDGCRGSGKTRTARLLTPEGCETYRSVVGALMWAIQTNPEVGETASELAGGLQCPTAADAVLLATTIEHLHNDPGSIVLHRLFGARLDVLSYSDSSLNNRGTKTQGGDCQFVFASDAPPNATGADIYELLKNQDVTVNPVSVVSQGIARVVNSSFDGETLSLDRAATSAVYYAFSIDEYVHGRPRTLEARAYFGGPGATAPVDRKTRTVSLSDGQSTVKTVTSTKLTQRNKRRASDIGSLREHFSEDGSGDFLKHIADVLNLSDCLTKKMSLFSEPIDRLRRVLRGSKLLIP